MKTPQEWLKEIKHLSDTEIRHGSSVFLTEEDLKAVQIDAWRRGMTDAMRICEAWNVDNQRIEAIEHVKDHKPIYSDRNPV